MEKICTATEDCQKPVFRRGWCSMHYERWKKYGNFETVKKPGREPRLAECSVQGCGRPAIARDLCGKHYQRWAKFGDPLTVKLDREQSLENRFWSKVDKNGPIPDYAPHLGPCWLWTGGIASGYGIMSVNNRQEKAHILSYTWVNGEIPDGWERDHLCRVTNCVRPDHLQAVPPRVNKIRGLSFSGVNHRKNHRDGETMCPECSPDQYWRTV